MHRPWPHLKPIQFNVAEEDALCLLLLMFPRFLHTPSISLQTTIPFMNLSTVLRVQILNPNQWHFIQFTQHKSMSHDNHREDINFVWPLWSFTFQCHYSIPQTIIHRPKKMSNIFCFFFVLLYVSHFLHWITSEDVLYKLQLKGNRKKEKTSPPSAQS